MIQLYIKRHGFERVKTEVPTLVDLFINYARLLPELPQLENVFYTLHDSGAGDREFQACTTVAFDIDKGPDVTKWPDYLKVVSGVVGTTTEAATVVSSGHGLHIIFHQAEHWSDPARFTLMRLQMRRIITNIHNRFAELGLPGQCDDGIYDRARVMRLPGTVNAKPDQAPVGCQLLQVASGTTNIDIAALSGIGHAPTTQVDSDFVKDWHGANDGPYIIEQCAVIKHAQSSADLPEPVWYAIDSVVARLDGGRDLLHKWSASHPKYNRERVDRKIDQALEASGPRTCAHMHSITPLCEGCPHFGKVVSPIKLQGPDFCPTSSSGYHTVSVSATGAIKRTPCFEDMIKEFRRKHHGAFVAHAESVYTWTGDHYRQMADDVAKSFAYTRFNPRSSKLGDEFLKQVCMSEDIKPIEWFRETTEHKLNLRNGVFDLNTMRLLPHAPDRGFKHVLGFDWDPLATCPEFDQFLVNVTCGDKDLERALLEYMAYVIAGGRCSAELILVLTGEGANGKTTFLRIFKAILGSSLVSMRPNDFATYGLIRLDGALACMIEELSSYKDRDFWELMKTLSSGGVVSARDIYKPVYEFENRAKIIMTCNVMPGGTDASHGFYRRLMPVPFNATFSDEIKDEGLGDRIIAGELPGVLNRLLDVYKRLSSSAFKIAQPQASKDARDAYMLDHDNILAWVNANFRLCSTAELPINPAPNYPPWLAIQSNLGHPLVIKAMAHQAYVAECQAAHHKPSTIANNVHFWRRVMAIYKDQKTVQMTRRNIGGKNEHVLTGIMPRDSLPSE